MADTQEPTAEQKKSFIIEALGIAGFTKNPDFPVYTQPHGMKTIVVDLTAGQSVYFSENKQKVVKDDEHNTLGKVAELITKAEDGQMPTKSDSDEVVHVPKKGDTLPPEPAHNEPLRDLTGAANVPAVLGTPQALTQQAMPELSIDIIKKYINDKATDEEAYVFLQLCQARGLNPFLKEAYLVKYDHTKPASMVVGKDAFMKRAEVHIEYDGIEAGIIVESEDKKDYVVVDDNRVGTFLRDGEQLLGGWAKVYRKDHSHPTEITVSMQEYNTGRSSWAKMPATMIRKVALVQALREAFPSELSGMYDQSEIGVEVVT